MSRAAIPEVTADVVSPFLRNLETTISPGYPGNIKIHYRSESLKRRVDCRVQYPKPVTSRLMSISGGTAQDIYFFISKST